MISQHICDALVISLLKLLEQYDEDASAVYCRSLIDDSAVTRDAIVVNEALFEAAICFDTREYSYFACMM